MKRIVKPIIGNYYGCVEVYLKEDGHYYLTLGNYDGDYGVMISEKLAMAIKEEFENEKEIVEI